MALNAPAREIVNLIKRHRLTYNALRKATHEARKHLKMKPPMGGRKLPHLLPKDTLVRFYNTIDGAGNLQHQIMLRLLFFSGVRVGELVAIRVEDVDLAGSRIFVNQGKGAKDRYVLFPEAFRLILQAHLATNPENRFLFESKRKDCFTPRQVQRIVRHYSDLAGLPVDAHPHLFRHQLLTYLTEEGLSDAQIQLISGHASKKSLEVYQHMGLQKVGADYQEAMKKLGI
jgi:integrase/recombinase XerD